MGASYLLSGTTGTKFRLYEGPGSNTAARRGGHRASAAR
eukprot:SAG31_NODE_32929_length_350_cov_0.621514_1_plen_38_part_01